MDTDFGDDAYAPPHLPILPMPSLVAVTWLHANHHKERFLLSRFGWIAEELGAYKAAYRFCDWK